MRVALVTGAYNYITDGISLTLNRLVSYLESRGVEVLVFAPTAPAAAFPHAGSLVPVPSVPVPGRTEYRFALGLPRAARRRLRDFDPDIVHIAVPDLLGYRALRLARAWKVPVVASYHTRYETYFKYYWFAPLKPLSVRYLRWFYGACREVYVPSASMAEVLKEQGIDDLRPWPRGVDSTHFSPARKSPAWRKEHGFEHPVVAFVGRFVREKQLATVIDACTALKSRGVPHHVALVGDGPDAALLKSALPHAVFPGFLTGDALATAYASADVFFFPSDTESFGQVTLEAMASGLPCVCADATGSRSLVEHGVTGFLAPIGHTDRFVDHLADLITDAATRTQMGEAARARSLGFNWTEAMAAIHGYYESLVGT